jgi:hypothetical protein
MIIPPLLKWYLLKGLVFTRSLNIVLQPVSRNLEKPSAMPAEPEMWIHIKNYEIVIKLQHPELCVLVDKTANLHG